MPEREVSRIAHLPQPQIHRISICCDPEWREKVRAAAKGDNRSLSDWIRQLINRELEGREGGSRRRRR